MFLLFSEAMAHRWLEQRFRLMMGKQRCTGQRTRSETGSASPHEDRELEEAAARLRKARPRVRSYSAELIRVRNSGERLISTGSRSVWPPTVTPTTPAPIAALVTRPQALARKPPPSTAASQPAAGGGGGESGRDHRRGAQHHRGARTDNFAGSVQDLDGIRPRLERFEAEPAVGCRISSCRRSRRSAGFATAWRSAHRLARRSAGRARDEAVQSCAAEPAATEGTLGTTSANIRADNNDTTRDRDGNMDNLTATMARWMGGGQGLHAM